MLPCRSPRPSHPGGTGSSLGGKGLHLSIPATGDRADQHHRHQRSGDPRSPPRSTYLQATGRPRTSSPISLLYCRWRASGSSLRSRLLTVPCTATPRPIPPTNNQPSAAPMSPRMAVTMDADHGSAPDDHDPSVGGDLPHAHRRTLARDSDENKVSYPPARPTSGRASWTPPSLLPWCPWQSSSDALQVLAAIVLVYVVVGTRWEPQERSPTRTTPRRPDQRRRSW